MSEQNSVIADRNLVHSVFPGCFTDLSGCVMVVRDRDGRLIAQGGNFGAAYTNAATVARRHVERNAASAASARPDTNWTAFGLAVAGAVVAVGCLVGAVALTLWAAMHLCAWIARLPGNPAGLAFLALIALGVVAAHRAELKAKRKESSDAAL